MRICLVHNHVTDQRLPIQQLRKRTADNAVTFAAVRSRLGCGFGRGAMQYCRSVDTGIGCIMFGEGTERDFQFFSTKTLYSGLSFLAFTWLES